MEPNKLAILTQLVSSLRQNLLIFEQAYNNSDKEKFDSSKKNILDLQAKISAALK